ncbi:hypothetical protein F3J34_38790 [Klebsiella sp. Ap-873]|nr:hypothetical protein [Klebsiella sp. Ap-873]
MFESTALDAQESKAIVGGLTWHDYNKMGPYGECSRKIIGNINNPSFGPWKRKGKSGERKDGSLKDCDEK